MTGPFRMPISCRAALSCLAWLMPMPTRPSVPGRRFLGAAATADIVTYHHDPREDPSQLAHPAAVVVGGTRLR